MSIAETREEETPHDGLPLEQFITYRLLRVHSKLNAQAIRILSTHAGITLTQWRVLVLTGESGDSTLTDLHKQSQIDKGQLSRCIKGMVETGLLLVRSDNRDNRQQVLSLTQKGQEIFEKMLPRMRARQSFLISQLDEVEKQAMYTAIDKLEQAAEMEVPE